MLIHIIFMRDSSLNLREVVCLLSKLEIKVEEESEVRGMFQSILKNISLI